MTYEDVETRSQTHQTGKMGPITHFCQQELYWITKNLHPTAWRCPDAICRGITRTLPLFYIYLRGKIVVCACTQVTVKSGSALFIPEGSFHEVRSSPGG